MRADVLYNQAVTHIQINDSVPDYLKQTTKYKDIRAEMEINLADDSKIHHYATHESGHLVYLIRTKLITSPSDGIFLGPTIASNFDDLVQFYAAVSSKTICASYGPIPYTDELLERMALCAVAAGIFEKEIVGEDEDTAKAIHGDKNTLFGHCKDARRYGMEFEGHTLWTRAENQVLPWVQNQRNDVDALVKIARLVILKKCFKLEEQLSEGDVLPNQHPEVVSLLTRLLSE